MNVLERCILHFLDSYASSCQALSGKRPIPKALDDLALSALLLIAEHGDKLSTEKLSAEKTSSEKLSNRESILNSLDNAIAASRDCGSEDADVHASWFIAYQEWEEMPFTLAKAILTEGINVPGYGSIYLRGLRHHQSSVRWYMYQVGWFVRHLLPRDEVVAALLENIATTLGNVEDAFGLAASLFQSEEEFFSWADLYRSEFGEYADQYRLRLEQAKQPGRIERYKTGFYLRELGVRKGIEGEVMGFKVGPVVGRQGVLGF